jgi:hypothetical protein
VIFVISNSLNPQVWVEINHGCTQMDTDGVVLGFGWVFDVLIGSGYS